MPREDHERGSRHFRSIWISDVHLGTAGCRADHLLDFLRHHESDYLYLVGDIVDGWQLKKSWYWKQSHNDVVQKISQSPKGTRVCYIPGNHDEVARQFAGLDFGGIEIRMHAVHRTIDGKRLLVTHGDEFDGVIQYAKWLAYLGDSLYTAILKINRVYNLGPHEAGVPLLVTLAVPEAQGQKRGELHRRLRARPGQRSAPSRI